MKKSLLLLISICYLCLLNGCGTSSTPPPPPPVATQFSVTAPATATAGTPFNVTVTALDASNRMVSSYSGTVQLTSSDGQPVQPPNATLTSGTGTFPVTLNNAGSPTITATAASLKGTSNAITVASVAPTQFSVVLTGYNYATSGSPFNITVTAVDATGNTVTGYSGTVHFTSSDGHAVLPGDSPLSNGVKTFLVTLSTSGGQTVTVTDKASNSISGSSNVIYVSGPATHFSVSPTSGAATRSNLVLFVNALDASNNVSTGYTGTVQIKSLSDPSAILPASATMQYGSANFQITFESSGNQTVTATDTVTSSITGTSTPIAVTLTPKLQINSGAPPNGTVGSSYGPTTTVYEKCFWLLSTRTQYCTPCVPNSIAGCGGATLPSCRRASQYAVCILTVTYSGFELKGTGGIPPYTWTASSLPSGLALNLESGGKIFINGTPAPGTAATYQASVTLNDAGQPPAPFNAIYPIVISNPPPPVVSTTPLFPGATLNQPFTYTFSATGGLPPYQNWMETGALPTGIAQLTTSGVLSGTPTVTGPFAISVTVEDAIPQASAAQAFTLIVYQHGFKPEGSMGTARSCHTATLLNTGKVLVTGGGSATAELFDPTTGTFTPTTGGMGTARTCDTATLLSSGNVLVAGGMDATGTSLATAELYNPATGSFSPTGTMGTARSHHTATLLAGGKVLVTGGNNAATLAAAELFDPTTGTFTPTTGGMGTARTDHAATLLNDGKVLVTGGFNAVALATAELFDPTSETFTPTTGNMAVARVSLTATLLNTGKVLVAGGNHTGTAELFDPATEIFSPTGTMETARAGHTATLLSDGTVLLAGGNDANNNFLAAAELFDPVSGTFAGTGGMQTPRGSHTATLLKDGTVLVTGGGNPAAVLATAELYQ